MSRSVYIATPALDGRVWADTATTVSALRVALNAAGIPSVWHVLGELPYMHMARNKLVRAFLNSDATDMLFWDSDVGFMPNTMGRSIAQTLAMLQADVRGVEIVCGATPLKQACEGYPIAEVQDAQSIAVPGLAGGLVEVEHGPTGYMRIRRGVFEKLLAKDMAPHVVDRGPSGKKRGEYDAYFELPIRNQAAMGEDVEFCRKAAAAGMAVWLAPDIEFVHAGPAHWIGNYREWKTGMPDGAGGAARDARNAG